MNDKSCPYDYSPLVLADESETQKTYKCSHDGCKYSCTERTPLGWVIMVGPLLVSVTLGLLGFHHHRSGSGQS